MSRIMWKLADFIEIGSFFHKSKNFWKNENFSGWNSLAVMILYDRFSKFWSWIPPSRFEIQTLMYAYYIPILNYIHTVDTCMIAVCINVYMVTFDGYITALARLICMQELELCLLKALALITDRLWIVLTLMTDSCYWNLALLNVYNNMTINFILNAKTNLQN